MLMTIIREYKEKATLGTMYVQGNLFCYTLEPEKVKCIPEGEYQVHLTYSPKFNRVMPQVMNVSGFEGIRIHWGNFRKDTQGCPLVGYEKGIDANGVECVLCSKQCFDELNRWLTEANKGQALVLEVKSL